MTQPEPALPQRVELSVDAPIEAGAYANFVGVWNLPDCFVLDFAVVTQPPRPAEDDDGEKFMHVSARMVARVRIPPGQVFELMKALNLQLTAWEVHTGNRRPDPDQ